MAFLHTRGELKDGTVHWILEGHQFEFSLEEFMEMTGSFREHGLFAYLTHERPALLDQLKELRESEFAYSVEAEDLEFVLEQSMLDLLQRLRL